MASLAGLASNAEGYGSKPRNKRPREHSESFNASWAGGSRRGTFGQAGGGSHVPPSSIKAV
eukprot:1145289-Pelagomonas_calceolata.AAC.2